ncbi:MAG: hypothetical protein WD266_03385 [Balneolales bacterium]
MAVFNTHDVLPESLYRQITQVRVDDPGRSLKIAQERRKAGRLTGDGKLNMLAIDHPARRTTAIGADPLRMADRRDLLGRIMRVLAGTRVDGIMATMDILEELFILDSIMPARNGGGLLKGKLIMASLNRGGLTGSAWEMDDPVTGPSPGTCLQWNFDGAKILLRIHDGEPASLKTLLASAKAITEMNALDLPVFLEPLPVVKQKGKYAVVKDRDALTAIVGVASALGDSSRNLWLKLPYCAHFEKVAASTTLPILILGGDSTGDDLAMLKILSGGMQAGSNVRGAMMGRNVLYPGDRDPLAVAEAAGGIIHEGWSVEEAGEFQQQRV